MVTDPPHNIALGVGDCPEVAKQRHIRTDGLKIENDAMGNTEFEDFLFDAFRNGSSVMKPGAAIYVWYASTSQKSAQTALERAGFPPRQILIWAKDTFSLGRQDYQWQHEPCFYGWKDGAAHYFIDARDKSTVIEDYPDIKKMTGAEAKRLLKEILNGDTQTTILREAKPAKSAEHPTMKPVRLIARLIRNSSRNGEAVLDLFGGSGTTLMAAEQLDRTAYLMEYDPRFVDVIIKRWEKFTGQKAEKIKGDEGNV